MEKLEQELADLLAEVRRECEVRLSAVEDDALHDYLAEHIEKWIRRECAWAVMRWGSQNINKSNRPPAKFYEWVHSLQ